MGEGRAQVGNQCDVMCASDACLIPCFSPCPTEDPAGDADENEDPGPGYGSRSTLTPIRASRKQQQKLGSETVLTPVRRSSRIRFGNKTNGGAEKVRGRAFHLLLLVSCSPC